MFYTIDKKLTHDVIESLDGVESLAIVVNNDKTFIKEFSSNFPNN